MIKIKKLINKNVTVLEKVEETVSEYKSYNYKVGDIIAERHESYVEHYGGVLEEVKNKLVKKYEEIQKKTKHKKSHKHKQSFVEKAKDLVEDLLDDGKLNNSNKRVK